MKKAICLITIRPNKIWLDFLNNFENYDIYVVIDDLLTNYDDYINTYSNINFIKISDDECKYYGYVHSSYMPTSSLIFNEIISWDRALCYFTNINTKYEHIWFFEDDVFFYNENTLLQIDLKHNGADLLCKDKNPQPKEGEWCWFWPAIEIHFKPPYFHSPICAIRVSKTYLEKLNEYIKINKKLAFIEALLPSIGYYNNLTVELVNEFNKIFWRHDWQLSELNKYDVYHPMKNMEQQNEMRDYLSNI
jgi:hypothetical protein